MAASPLTGCFDHPRNRGGRFEVEPPLTVPNPPRVFCAGDLVSLVDRDGKSVPGLALAVMQMGKHVAKILNEDLSLLKTVYKDRYLELRPAFSYQVKGKWQSSTKTLP